MVLLIAKLAVAFCSIAYELVLAQTLSVFLSNTVLRYCVTIGLYMFSMGIGAFLAEKRLGRSPARTFWQIEVLLTALGVLSLPSLFFVDTLGMELVFLVWSHALICLIGLATGFELPLAIELGHRSGRPSRNALLAVDYIGAFLGTLGFVFLIYPVTGLFVAAWAIAFLNALVALGISLKWRRDVPAGWIFSLIMIVIVMVGLMTVPAQEQFLTRLYLR